LRFQTVEFVLFRSQLLLGLDFCHLTFLLKVRRGFEVGLGALERLFDLRRALRSVWGLVLEMLDFRRFTLHNGLHFSELRASVIQVLRRTRYGHFLDLQARQQNLGALYSSQRNLEGLAKFTDLR